MDDLESLPGLGPKSAGWLRQVGISNRQALVDAGPVAAFLKLKQAGIQPGLNLLYALVGAVEDRHWTDVARKEKTRLLTELDAAESFCQISDPDSRALIR